MTDIKINLTPEEIAELDAARQRNAPDLSLEDYIAELLHAALERMNPPPF